MEDLMMINLIHPSIGAAMILSAIAILGKICIDIQKSNRERISMFQHDLVEFVGAAHALSVACYAAEFRGLCILLSGEFINLMTITTRSHTSLCLQTTNKCFLDLLDSLLQETVVSTDVDEHGKDRVNDLIKKINERSKTIIKNHDFFPSRWWQEQ